MPEGHVNKLDNVFATEMSVEGGCFNEAIEKYFELGWTDGLPVVPPTKEKIDKFVEFLGGNPDFIECKVPPRWGGLSRGVLAINMIMAGCKAEYAPVVILTIVSNRTHPPSSSITVEAVLLGRVSAEYQSFSESDIECGDPRTRFNR